MLRKRSFFFCVATAVAISGAVAACGGDDTVVPTGNNDGGTDGTAHVDGGPLDGGNDTAPSEGGDGGPCDFNQFVIGLIQNHTNSTDQPSVDLGQNCVDTKTPFPSTLFQ